MGERPLNETKLRKPSDEPTEAGTFGGSHATAEHTSAVCATLLLQVQDGVRETKFALPEGCQSRKSDEYEACQLLPQIVWIFRWHNRD